MTTFDDVLVNNVGGFGRYQKLILTIVNFYSICLAFNIMEMEFTQAAPKFWPAGFNMSFTGDPCEYEKWEYDNTTFKRTIISEFNLVCDRAWIAASVKSAYLAGPCLVLILGGLSDRFGRKRVLSCLLVANVVGRIMQSFVCHLGIYAAIRFCIGATSHVAYAVSFVLMQELVDPSKRTLVGALPNMAWVVGYETTVVLAYFIRDRFVLELSFTAFYVPCLILLWFVPESPRWLYCKNRKSEADAIMHNLSKWNRTEFKESMTERLVSDIEDNEHKTNCQKINEVVDNRIFLLRLALLMLSWFATELSYYGLLFNSRNLDGDLYLNIALNGLVEVPPYIAIPFVLSSRMGRVISTSCGFMLTGVSLLCTLLISSSVASIIFFLAGKLFITYVLVSTYIHTIELMPTSMRALGTGACSFASRIVIIATPYLVQTATSVPLLIRGSVVIGLFIMSCTAGACYLLLPETRGLDLSETIEEATRLKGFLQTKCASRRTKTSNVHEQESHTIS